MLGYWQRYLFFSSAIVPPPQELLQAKQDLQDLLIAKEEQEDLLRKRERELTALKGALKEEVSSHDQEMDKLKEQYDAELQALRESVEEATKVSWVPTGVSRCSQIRGYAHSPMPTPLGIINHGEELVDKGQVDG